MDPLPSSCLLLPEVIFAPVLQEREPFLSHQVFLLSKGGIFALGHMFVVS